MAESAPSVTAVLVAHDGEAWLPTALAALEDQTYRNLQVVAVDNLSHDRSREILLSRLSQDRVLVAERDLGYAGAVALALDATAESDLVLLLHDDLALAPNAVEELVDALMADPSLAVVGCKLVDWDDPGRLQTVGWSVDLSGRADTGLDPGERDQGQRDRRRRPLVVSTAGMLVRRDVFDGLGRLDRRYHLFRDDLDFCWRAWLAGWDVEVVPAAVGRHVRAASNYRRLGQTAFLGPRYFAERNTLATLLKSYGPARLAVVLPVFVVVGLAKIVGFVATRRVGDAWQTLRAWAWNALNLRATLRLRDQVQAQRRRTDRELRPLFVRVGPRLRAYAEATGDWLTGGGTAVEDVLPPELTDAEPESATHRLVALVRRHPVGIAAGALLLVGIVLALPLLPGGPLRGGELSPFPSSSQPFFADYVASWHDASGVGTSVAPSPAQAVLGLLQMLSLGSAYLASRLLILGAVPVAWLLALRAVAPLAPTRGPRVAAATVYALSPTGLAALRTGDVSALVLFALLPGLIAALHGMVAADRDRVSAWRSAAGAILLAAVIVSFQPAAMVGLALALATLAGYAGLHVRRGASRQTLARIGVVAVGTLLVLFPWSLRLFGPDSPIAGGGVPIGANAHPLWQWLLQAPDEPGFTLVLAGAGAVVAGIFGLLFAARTHLAAAATLWGTALTGAVLASLAGRAGPDAWVWPGAPLVFTAASFAGLFAIGLRSASERLAEHDFGWRQLGAGLMVLAALAGAVVALAPMFGQGWDAYAINRPSIPEFLALEDSPYVRVVTLADVAGEVAWDISRAEGPTMTGFGSAAPLGFISAVDEAIGDVVGGSDPGAVGRLALLNVVYVVVPEGGRSERLDRALAAQLDLEPVPVADGEIFRVVGAVPRVSFIPPESLDTIARRGAPAFGVPSIAFEHTEGSRWSGLAPRDGAVLVAEVDAHGWEAVDEDGQELDRLDLAGLVAFEVPEGGSQIVVKHASQAARTVAVVFELVMVLLTLSLLLRPPRLAMWSSQEPLP